MNVSKGASRTMIGDEKTAAGIYVCMDEGIEGMMMMMMMP